LPQQAVRFILDLTNFYEYTLPFMNIRYLTKRTGEIVPFDKERIANAIFWAATSVQGKDYDIAKDLTEIVCKKIDQKFQNKPISVEEVQDIVENVLIEQNYKKTAKAYILYRSKRAEERETRKKEVLEKISQHKAKITLEDGSIVDFDNNSMLQELEQIAKGLRIDCGTLFLDACSHLYNGIHLKELKTALVNAARNKIELSIDYSYFAARLVLNKIYNQTIQISLKDKDFEEKYRDSFYNYLQEGVANGSLNKNLLEFDIPKIQKALTPKRDLLFQYRGIQTIHDRYLLRTTDEKRQIFELPQYFWMRVAMGLASSEKTDHTKYAIDFYNCISTMSYIPSTPTLFNAGTTHSQLSSCFLNTVEDSLKGIFKNYSDNAMLSKYAGGIGTDWTNVRSLGSQIKGTNGNSQGIIPFLKIFNDIAIAVNQGGKRKGAMCAYLELWHADVEEFLEAKKNTGDDRRRLHDIHTALWIPDLFMKRLEKNEDWTLFSPQQVESLHDLYGKEFEEKYQEYESKELSTAKRIPALILWKKIITMLFETGHPWLTFKDPCNIRNPQSHVGVIHNSNLCTEITLNNSEQETAVCNLGSLNLAKMIFNKKIDEEKLKNTIQQAMRMLDNVIDINYYPTVETKNSNNKHRPVGLGVMGYQDLLFQMDVPFASEEQVKIADTLMEKISFYAIQSSSKLAKEKGKYLSFEGSKWDQGLLPLDTYKLLSKTRGELEGYNDDSTMPWESLKKEIKEHGMRNSNCLAIAPTATISNITGTNPCIEPIFRNIYTKENTDGSFIVINHYLMEDLKKRKLWTKDVIEQIKYYDGSLSQIKQIPESIRRKYQEVFEIDTLWLLKSAAARSKWIDQSQSLNIFTSSTSGKILSDTYQMAWKMGLKTTYYLRSLSVSQIEKNLDIQKIEEQQNEEEKQSEPVSCAIDDVDCEACQ
jgi:ribonucleoside-diphosphate reductase alpha chain